MTLSHDDTKFLIDMVLRTPEVDARKVLNLELKQGGWNEGQFYESIAKHGPTMRYSSEQWFDLHSKLPNRLLRSEFPPERKLSENQLKRLRPVIGSQT